MSWINEKDHIHTEDTLMPGFTYQQLIDVVHANCKIKDKASIRKEARSLMKMCVNEMMDALDMYIDDVEKEINR